MVSRLAINRIAEILRDGSALSYICLTAPQLVINGKLHLTSSSFSFFKFGNGNVYNYSAINVASSALKVTARVGVEVHFWTEYLRIYTQQL